MIKNLSGFVVGVSADRRSEEQIALLEGRGAQCIHGRTVRTLPLGCQDTIAAATESLIAQPPDALVVQTGIGLRSWFGAIEASGAAARLREVLGDVPVLCRGPKAAGASIAVGLEVAWCGEPATAAVVAEYVTNEFPLGARIAVQNDGDPNPWLANHLSGAGYDAMAVPVYRWTLPDDPSGAEVLVRAIAERRVDAVTFTSRPALENLVTIATGMEVDDAIFRSFQSEVIASCVGPVTAARAREFGFGEVLEPERHRLGGMVQQLSEVLAARSRPIRLAGHELVLRGHQVDGLEEPAQLAGRERAVLEALLERPGAVRSKASLLDEVWNSREPGAHTVEVTVGRLRQRLGPAGAGIETVIRRGYRVRAD